ncbi:MAG TPA: ABC transporter permease [Chloroflexota bacterium]|jgi:ABC-2 type transport system permease protein|nr:ABC transporter permease [Chloroflexota bacterium]
MGELFRLIVKTWVRTTSFIGKELIEVVRRPGALLSLVLGPFLVMTLFGIGYSGQRRPLDTVLVVPPGSTLPREVAAYEELGPTGGLRLVEVTEDLESARDRLQRQAIDLVVIAPTDPEGRFREGRQSEIGVEFNQIDPIVGNYVRFVAYRQVQELNAKVIELAARQGLQYAVQTLGSNELTRVPPYVIAQPTRAEIRNLAQTTPAVVTFFAPAVLALVLQHMAVTLSALSMVRERLGGAIELFRVAPVTPMEILIGKYLGYGFLSVLIAAIGAALLVFGLGVPLRGDLPWFAGVILLLSFASLGLGLLISILADSERQAVQLSMLVLLASVFFSGFVLPLEDFLPQVRWFAYALPVTHGIRLLQDFMLRGGTYAVWQLWALAAVGIGLFLVSALSLRRSLAHA